MAKNKQFEIEYKAERNKRMILRKQARYYTRKYKLTYKTKNCKGCGEDPYCYCGDGTPYSY